MKLDAQIAPYTPLAEVPEIARAAEELGFDCLWTAETMHNPFLPGALIAEHTRRLRFGTAIAVSFARSPAVMAQTTWDLAEFSQGRFILGLGTQVRAHIVRRFGMDWPDSVTGKLGEQIDVIRAFWRNWAHGEKLCYAGEYYQINLSSPFFTPSSHDFADIPIFIAGVNTGLAKLAGETADGFHAHPFHTRAYLQDVLLPRMDQGAQQAGRSLADVDIVAHAFVVTNSMEREFVRYQIAFYASTPSYEAVMAHHGWKEEAASLSALVRENRWGDLSALVTDQMVDTIATVASEAELGDALKERYQGIAGRINLYLPFIPGERTTFWQTLLKSFQT